MIKVMARLLAVLATGLLVGWWQDNPVLYTMLALLGYLAWQMWQLVQFEAWLKAGGGEDAPELAGTWAEMVSIIIHTKRKSRMRKQRYKVLLKEFRRSTSALPDGTVLLNADNEIAWFNHAAARMLGLRKSTDRRQGIESFIRDPEFVDFLRGDEAGASLVMRAVQEAGHYYSLQLIPYGQEQRLLLIKDITREVNNERMRRDFVANASHELRSPLTVLTGYLDSMAEDKSLDRLWREPVTQMQTQTRRMTAIVSDLLQLSRLEEGDEQARTEEVDVAGLIGLVRKEALASPSCPQHLEVHIDSPARIIGMESELHSAFSNLVDNAVKFTSREGRVVIRWRADASGGYLSVSDTGIGIEAEEIPRITERFYRVDKGRAREAGGTGLGLAIVKHVLHRHGATLAVESEPGQGSSFTCHFPASRIAPSS